MLASIHPGLQQRSGNLRDARDKQEKTEMCGCSARARRVSAISPVWSPPCVACRLVTLSCVEPSSTMPNLRPHWPGELCQPHAGDFLGPHPTQLIQHCQGALFSAPGWPALLHTLPEAFPVARSLWQLVRTPRILLAAGSASAFLDQLLGISGPR